MTWNSMQVAGDGMVFARGGGAEIEDESERRDEGERRRRPPRRAASRRGAVHRIAAVAEPDLDPFVDTP